MRGCPPGTERRAPTQAAQELTSLGAAEEGKRRSHNRPRPLPSTSFFFADREQVSSIFTPAISESIRAPMGLAFVADDTPASLAAALSELSEQFLLECSVPVTSPPGEREEWAKSVEKNARALLANFGTDPDTLGRLPPADGVIALFGLDQPFPLSLMPKTADGRRESFKQLRNTRWFLDEMGLPVRMDRVAGMEQSTLEHTSLCEDLRPDQMVEAEALRTLLLGLAYVARSAAMAAAAYGEVKRRPKRLTPERRFLLGLLQAYRDAFGSNAPMYTTNPIDDQRAGPVIDFCQAVAKHLKKCNPLPGSDPHRHSTMLEMLDRWAAKPEVVVTAIRNARAVDPQAEVWRRQTAGPREAKLDLKAP